MDRNYAYAIEYLDGIRGVAAVYFPRDGQPAWAIIAPPSAVGAEFVCPLCRDAFELVSVGSGHVELSRLSCDCWQEKPFQLECGGYLFVARYLTTYPVRYKTASGSIAIMVPGSTSGDPVHPLMVISVLPPFPSVETERTIVCPFCCRTFVVRWRFHTERGRKLYVPAIVQQCDCGWEYEVSHSEYHRGVKSRVYYDQFVAQALLPPGARGDAHVYDGQE